MSKYFRRTAVFFFLLWIALDLSVPLGHDLRSFDPHRVAALETEMWRAYYDHRPIPLFVDLTTLLRSQFGLPFWRSCLGAWYAAHAAVVFQRGASRADYEKALPDLTRYYSLIRRASATPFDTNRVARLELEWWIDHRNRDPRLTQSLAELQSAIYNRPSTSFTAHAQARAEAMRIRDEAADWPKISVLLDQSWQSLKQTVH